MINPDDPAPEPPSGVSDTANGGLPGSNEAAPAASSAIRTWTLALAAGLAAGLVAWAIGEVALTPDSGLVRRRGNLDPLASEVGLRNAIVCFGAFGAAMGLGLGLAGGLVRRSVGRMVLAAPTGLVLGAVTGWGMARLLVPIYYEHIGTDVLTYALIVHCGIWGVLGGAVGVAFGLGVGGWGRLPRVTVGGAGAALLATVIYEFVGAILFPLAMTEQPVSATRESRLLAQLLVALLVAAGAVLCAGPDGDSPPQSESKT